MKKYILVEQEKVTSPDGRDFTQPYDESTDNTKPTPDNNNNNNNTNPNPNPKKKKVGFNWIPSPTCDEVQSGAKEIKKGMRGACVGVIQKKLNEVNSAGLSPDQKFWKLTEGAVVAFQNKNQISPANGVVNKQTYEKLFNTADSNVLTDVEPEGDSEFTAESKRTTSKRILSEQPVKEKFPNDANRANMQEALEFCFDRFVNKKLITSYDKRVRTSSDTKRAYVVGTDPNGKMLYFYDNGKLQKAIKKQNGQIQKDGDPITWSCDIPKYRADKTSAATTQSQTDYIKKLQAQYPQYETTDDPVTMELKVKKGLYKKIDLNGISDSASKLFPEPNKYFVYEKVASQSDTYKEQVLNMFTAGTEYIVVDCQTPLTNDFITQIMDLSAIENGKYSKVFQPGEVCIVASRTRGELGGKLQDESSWEKFLQDNQSNFKVSNVGKKLCRQTINNYADALERNLPLSNTAILPLVKQFLKNCNNQHTFHAGTKNDLNKISYSSKKNHPGNIYALKEQNLSTIIRKNLVEITEQKKNFITETKIVKNRLTLLRESIGKKKNNRRLVFLSVVNEVKNLRNQGISDKIISEQFEDFFNALGGFFGKSGVQSTIAGGIGGTFVEYAAEFLIKMLGIPTNSPVAQLFITSIGNIGSFENIPRMLTECDFTAGLLAKSIVESIAKNYVDDYIGNGFLASALRNTLTDAAFSTDLVSGIQKNISGKVCEIIGQLGDKAGEKAKEMKNKALS
jgi:hypothetical protein